MEEECQVSRLSTKRFKWGEGGGGGERGEIDDPSEGHFLYRVNFFPTVNSIQTWRHIPTTFFEIEIIHIRLSILDKGISVNY